MTIVLGTVIIFLTEISGVLFGHLTGIAGMQNQMEVLVKQM